MGTEVRASGSHGSMQLCGKGKKRLLGEGGSPRRMLVSDRATWQPVERNIETFKNLA